MTEQHGDRYTLFLHGRVAGEWVPLLDRYWRSIADTVPSARVTTVLSDVSFVDQDGERLIERMWGQGVQFVASGCMNRHLIDKIRQPPSAGVEERARTSRGRARGGRQQ